MSVHTLYQPATVATASSVRKTKALTDAIAKLEGEARGIELKIEEIADAHNPIIGPASHGLLKCQSNYRKMSKAARELRSEIEKTELQISELTTLLGNMKSALVVSDERLETAMVSRDAAEKAVAEAEAARAKETSKLSAHLTDRLGEIEKAKYRLSQHLARHPASAPPSEASPTEVVSNAEP